MKDDKMRKHPIVFAAVFIASSFLTGIAISEEPVVTQPDQVVLYCFCTDFCCPGCVNMKKWARQVVEFDFKDYSAGGKLTIKEVNLCDKGNEHFMDDYEICTSSLVLVLVKDGREAKFTNLGRALCFACCRAKFMPYIKDNISKYLKEL